jgi:hypothetical protein
MIARHREAGQTRVRYRTPTSSCWMSCTRLSTTTFARPLRRGAQMMLARGGILLATGHDYLALSSLCRPAIVLDRGTVITDGSFDEVTNGYLAAGRATGFLPSSGSRRC